jgi:hypothetical protein
MEYVNTDFPSMIWEMKSKIHELNVMKQLEESNSNNGLDGVSDNESFFDGSTTDRGGTTYRSDAPEGAFGDEYREINRVSIDQTTYRERYEILMNSYWKC